MTNISLARVNKALLLGVLTVIILYYARSFLIPLSFGILFSMLLLPVSRKLEQWGLGRKTATFICILIILLFVFGIVSIISAQANSFSKDLPQIQIKLQQLIDTVQHWIHSKVGVSTEQQVQFVKKQVDKFSQSANTYATSFLAGTFSILGGFVLVLLYFFFLMWKREKYEAFFLRVASKEHHSEVKKELDEITKVASQYVVGRLISMIFLIAVYAIGFYVIGLKNAVLVSFIAVLPTIVPYIGAYIGGIFPVIMALVSGSADMVVPVLLLLIIAQTFDNNVIEPLAQGETLNISPIITILALVVGNLLWGIAGMVLFVPMFAVIRIICEHVPALNPYGFLLANDVEDSPWVAKVKKWFKDKMQ